MNKTFIKAAFLLIFLVTVFLAVIHFGGFNKTGQETAGKQTFFDQFIIAGGPIVWFVLLPMSLLMVFLVFVHGLTIRRKRLLPMGIGKETVDIIKKNDLGKLEAEIAGRNDFVSAATLKSVTNGRGDWFRMKTLFAESLQDQALGLLRKIEWLNLIGNVSPMVGLFGTVFGMIKLFNAIVIAGGQPQPAQLAGGISIALVTTFWGLFVAIPALAIHGIFRNRIETLVSDAVVESENIIPQIRYSLKVQQARQSEYKKTNPKTSGRSAAVNAKKDLSF
ncbi:MAG: MotA/TolQ/ExbB proton channel family protein [Planctomycetota bacterium]|jgi:biopolymer transport protein ExbB